mgnify:CR=1 FL=1
MGVVGFDAKPGGDGGDIFGRVLYGGAREGEALGEVVMRDVKSGFVCGGFGVFDSVGFIEDDEVEGGVVEDEGCFAFVVEAKFGL